MPDVAAPRFLSERVVASKFEAILPLTADYQRFCGREPDGSRNLRLFCELLGDHHAHSRWPSHPDDRGGHETGVRTALLRTAAREAGNRGFSRLAGETAADNDQRRHGTTVSRAAADPGARWTRVHYSNPLSTKGEQ